MCFRSVFGLAGFSFLEKGKAGSGYSIMLRATLLCLLIRACSQLIQKPLKKAAKVQLNPHTSRIDRFDTDRYGP
jgi:hypothetical protein